MTGYESKRAAAQDKLDDDDTLTIAYQSGYYDGKKAAQPAQKCPNIKNCGGACFQCEYFNAEKGEMEYPILQPAQEPVAWMLDGEFYKTQQFHLEGGHYANQIPLYTTPPQRPWVGLTDEEIIEIHSAAEGQSVGVATGLTERKLKEKNT